ncbi:MAG: MBL fold metallo-hydrolase [Anaerolineae bacterium]|nr:MBL fold metallo-hydrolase [Anaerolineae bacterium]
MVVHFLNCFTCNARVPSDWRSGTICLLIETNQGLVLVDTGPGRDDYVHKPGIVRAFQLVTHLPLDPKEAAVHQVMGHGYRPEEVRDVVLTHMHSACSRLITAGACPTFPRRACTSTAASTRPSLGVRAAGPTWRTCAATLRTAPSWCCTMTRASAGSIYRRFACRSNRRCG